MQIIGIICEYNPFHNGHLYHLKKIKEMYPDSLIILVLNGYFLERGEISILSKEDKTKVALEMGIDVVVELPFVFGSQSADTFANKSIAILENLKCDYVAFGSESANVEILEKISEYTKKESKEYQRQVKKYLDEGYNYPTSLAKALNVDFTFNPNDLLGISYLKAIKQHNYQLKPILIKRTNAYHDITSNDTIISASNIRHKLAEGQDILEYVPKETQGYLQNIKAGDITKFKANLFTYLKYKIITEKDLSIYLDVDEGIDYRLKKIIYECSTLEELIENIKSKRYTYNKIRRMLIHILIGFTKEDNKNLTLDYLKVLGFNEKGQAYLNKIKKDLQIPLTINKSSLVYKYELITASLYGLITNRKTYEYEVKCQPYVLK